MSIKYGYAKALGATALLAGAGAMAILASSGVAGAATINVQFGDSSLNAPGVTGSGIYANGQQSGGYNSTPVYSGTGMDSQDTGTVWNQVFFPGYTTAGGTAYGTANATVGNLVYSNGSAATGVSVTVGAQNGAYSDASYNTQASGDSAMPTYMEGYLWNSVQYGTAPAIGPSTVEISGLTAGAKYQLYVYSALPYNESDTLFTLAAANTPAGSGSYLLIDPQQLYTNSSGAVTGSADIRNPASSQFASPGYATPTLVAPTADPSNANGDYGIFTAVADSSGNINFTYFNSGVSNGWGTGAASTAKSVKDDWYGINAMQIQSVSTPEPATLGLLALALGGLLLLSRRGVRRS